MPTVLKKEMKELKITSYLLLTGVIMILLIFLLKVVGNDGTGMPQPARKEGSLIDSVTIILTSYGFIMNFYPVYSSLEVCNTRNGMLSSSGAMLFCFVVYILFSHLGILSYGDAVSSDIFENISAEAPSVMNVSLRSIFICIFLCNIPFVVVPGREAILVLIDEY